MGAGAAGASEQRLPVRRRFEVFEMHMVIYSLVEASTEDEALSTGKTVFDRLVGADPHAGARLRLPRDVRRGGYVRCGKARWGELPTAAPSTPMTAKDLLERGWKATKEEFERNLDRVKEAIDEPDEEIMRDEDLARHAFHQVGAYDGPAIFLYTEHGTGIRHRGQLDRLLEESEELWIVPADVHF